METNEIILTIVCGLFVAIVGGTIVAIITKKIKITHKTITITHNSKEYVSLYDSGSFIFDYSNNNGEYTIGKDDKCFTTRWSKASDISIHACNDNNNISSIALIKENCNLENLNLIDADFSSRCRTPQINEIVIWKNIKGYYAATKIIKIKDDSRDSNTDELECEYVIYK